MPFTFTMPKLSPTMDEGTIAKWIKKEGEFVEAGEALLEISTDKATVEHNVLDPGWLRKILINEGDSAAVNQAIAIFTEEKEESIEGYEPEQLIAEEPEPAPEEKAEVTVKEVAQPAFAPAPPLETHAAPPPPTGERLRVSPLARKLAQEQGLDLTSVRGSGPGGRVMSRDLERAQKAGIVSFAYREKPDIAPGAYEEEALTPMRKVIGERLQQAKMFIPHFYVSMEIDAEPMIKVREQLAAGEIKITYNDFVIRACALALQKHPDVNSGYHAENNTIIRFKTVDVAVGVSIPGGLITPIIRHADYKSLGEVSTEMRALAEKARDGKLAPHEYQGGSFTISNMGMFGISDFQAIVNPPQAAILAVSAIQEKPVVRERQLVAGQLMNVTLSADHRVVDGVAGALFLKTLRSFLENPALLML